MRPDLFATVLVALAVRLEQLLQKVEERLNGFLLVQVLTASKDALAVV